MNTVFIQMSALLAVTVGVAFLIRLLRQPLIVAYIFAGIVCGPLALNLLHGDHAMYETFAEFGVVLLLFIIGLNLNFTHLRSIGRVSVITGLGQMVGTTGLGMAILLGLGIPFVSALYIATAITFSSTIIIMKLLTDKKDTDTIYGRYTVGLMLVQDIIAIGLVIVLGTMKGGGGMGWATVALLGGKLCAISILLFLVSRYLLPRILDRIADSSELLFLFTLTWCFGVASILYVLGFSLEIGAMISGIALSSSPYQLEIGSRIKPLRDFFLIVFFIVLGGGMGFGSIQTVFIPALIISVFVLLGKPLILYVLFRVLKFTRRNSFLSSVTAAQVSEFGFVLLFAGQQVGHVEHSDIAMFTIIAMVTIFVSSYLISYNEQLYRWMLPVFRLWGPDRRRQHDRAPETYDVWIIGYHRIGMKIAEVMTEMNTRFSVIDFDPAAVARLRKDAVPFYFGDIADVEFLEGLPLASSTMIIMTIPAVDDQLNLLTFVKKMNDKVLVIGNAYHKRDAELLYEHGAHFVMMPHFLGAQWISNVLRDKTWNHSTLLKLREEQRTSV